MKIAVAGDNVRQMMEERLKWASWAMWLLKSAAPFSTGAVLYKVYSFLTGAHRHLIWYSKSKLLTLLNCVMFSEVAFAVLCAVEKMKGQKRNQVEFETSRNERENLFNMCLRTVENPRDFATRWLRDSELQKIRKGNIEDWMAWGFFGKDFAHLENDEKKEIEMYGDRFQAICNYKLLPGHNGDVRCYKFDLEPVESQHRPLMYYAVVHGLLQRVALPIALRGMSFGEMRRQRSFNYWISRSKNLPTRPPIVLIHGIGIGPLPYLPFIRQIQNALPQEDPRDIVLIELPAVAQQLFPKRLLPTEFVEDIKKMFSHEGIQQAVFVGHSYGTFCLSWLVKFAPEVVSNVAFLDPVCFLLHHSTTLRAIVYKEAYTEEEKLFQYFLRSELFFNNHVRRHFNWIKNSLFLEQIPERCNALIVLSEHDDIMPVKEVHKLHSDSPHVQHISVLYLEKNVHGGLLFSDEGQVVAEHIVML